MAMPPKLVYGRILVERVESMHDPDQVSFVEKRYQTQGLILIIKSTLILLFGDMRQVG
ncbi:hypothetical protein PALB_1080 [Pseudoalteromonas luteoviolacea B = ATCC 29581]|nr:hypothetical protein PALB_1080 [Pseudoalteromonas luteoviolacea B = ATCC 29581]